MSPTAIEIEALAAAPPAPATPGLAYPDPLWSAGRPRSLEGQRQAYADELVAKDRTIDELGDENARLRAELAHAHRAIVDLSNEGDDRGKTMLRLRADLAQAGLALDALTAPEANP